MPHARIRLIAPSGYAHDPAVMRRGIARLREAGCTVEGEEVLARTQLRFAGTAAERAGDLDALAKLDTLPDVALVTRGGYGAAHLLDRLDYDALRERLAGSALALVGHSDFTALQLALYARSGVRSFAGPLLADLGTEPFPTFTWDHFWRTLSATPGGAAWAGAGEAEVDVRGPLWGGNLAVLCSLLGTPYFPAVEGGILFVEDLGEPPYRIERLFYQLHLSGVLGRQRALVLGDFEHCRPGPRDNGYDLAAALAELERIAGIPVIRGLPHGHGARQLTLPFGAEAHLHVSGGEATLRFGNYPHLPAGALRAVAS
ncbi:LD-carboxypeptidase [Fulvimonas yonginensis]|uniref:LD-carboxypeptidase n=1 Tax=Fulvimonas yonginensis TaxID=1495200 RepID=A0ABU8JB36_9GAMM